MKEELCLYAIDVLYAHLFNVKRCVTLDDDLEKEYPMFVTWKSKNGLRGCIGTTSPYPLKSGIERFALKSALEDDRFDPITSSELDSPSVSLKCSVSLLTDYEECETFHDWIIGKHGISIELFHNKTRFHSIFLPEVMIEHNLDHRNALKLLLKKCHFNHEIDDKLLKQLKVTRFQTKKATVAVEKYLLEVRRS